MSADTVELPQPTGDATVACADIDRCGYCLVSALEPEQVATVRTRFLEQVTAEEQRGVAYHLPDKKQLVKFLLNKGREFRDLLFHRTVRQVVDHVLGSAYLLSSYNGHIAHPGGLTAFHTDQFWMPPPVPRGEPTPLKPGEITRAGHRGRRFVDDANAPPAAIAPAFVCNAMWMLDDFTEANGATIVVPGSHLSGRQPDDGQDAAANWVAATGPAGTVAVFEGRTWHSTGVNRTRGTRIGLTTNFCAPQFRQQENFLLGTAPEVLENASDELLELIGFRAWEGYGGYENNYGFVRRGEYALGELRPVGEETFGKV